MLFRADERAWFPGYLVYPFSSQTPHGFLEMSFNWAESPGLDSCGNIVPTRTFAEAFSVSSKSPKAEAANFSMKGQLVNIFGFVRHMVNLCHNHSSPLWWPRITDK